MSELPRRLDINSSAIRIAGAGGLGMVAIVVVIAADLQPARWLLTLGIAGGALIAAALIAARWGRRLGEPRGDLPTSLFDGKATSDDARPSERQRSSETSDGPGVRDPRRARLNHAV